MPAQIGATSDNQPDYDTLLITADDRPPPSTRLPLAAHCRDHGYDHTKAMFISVLSTSGLPFVVPQLSGCSFQLSADFPAYLGLPSGTDDLLQLDTVTGVDGSRISVTKVAMAVVAPCNGISRPKRCRRARKKWPRIQLSHNFYSVRWRVSAVRFDTKQIDSPSAPVRAAVSRRAFRFNIAVTPLHFYRSQNILGWNSFTAEPPKLLNQQSNSKIQQLVCLN
ncbi:hypothetical protein Aduo_019235 [Ancylostoma duodenale]